MSSVNEVSQSVAGGLLCDERLVRLLRAETKYVLLATLTELFEQRF